MFVDPFIPFFLFIVALYATPGPATLSIAASGAAFGFRKTVPYVIGVLTGLFIIFILMAFGLGVLFEQYPTVHLIFQWVSLIYIFYLAYKIATSSFVKSSDAKHLGFLQGIPLALLNPKAIFAIIATVSQFTKTGADYYSDFVLITFWALAITFVFDLIWAYAGSLIGAKLATVGLASWVNILFALLLIVSVLITMFL